MIRKYRKLIVVLIVISTICLSTVVCSATSLEEQGYYEVVTYVDGEYIYETVDAADVEEYISNAKKKNIYRECVFYFSGIMDSYWQLEELMGKADLFSVGDGSEIRVSDIEDFTSFVEKYNGVYPYVMLDASEFVMYPMHTLPAFDIDKMEFVPFPYEGYFSHAEIVPASIWKIKFRGIYGDENEKSVKVMDIPRGVDGRSIKDYVDLGVAYTQQYNDDMQLAFNDDNTADIYGLQNAYTEDGWAVYVIIDAINNSSAGQCGGSIDYCFDTTMFCPLTAESETLGSLSIDVTSENIKDEEISVRLYTDLDCKTEALYYDDGWKNVGLNNSENGRIKIKNLKPGTYYCKTEKVPDGYRLPEITEITIDNSDKAATISGGEGDTVVINKDQSVVTTSYTDAYFDEDVYWTVIDIPDNEENYTNADVSDYGGDLFIVSSGEHVSAEKGDLVEVSSCDICIEDNAVKSCASLEEAVDYVNDELIGNAVVDTEDYQAAVTISQIYRDPECTTDISLKLEPMTLDFTISERVDVTGGYQADDTKTSSLVLTNNSDSGEITESLNLSPSDGWSVKPFEFNWESENVGSMTYGVQADNKADLYDTVNGDGYTASEAISPKGINTTTLCCRVPPRAEAADSVQIGRITATVGWSK